jgi:hypothetical protein
MLSTLTRPTQHNVCLLTCPAGPDGKEQLLYMNAGRDKAETVVMSYEAAADGSIKGPRKYAGQPDNPPPRMADSCKYVVRVRLVVFVGAEHAVRGQQNRRLNGAADRGACRVCSCAVLQELTASCTSGLKRDLSSWQM